jgi:hypothetical protein
VCQIARALSCHKEAAAVFHIEKVPRKLRVSLNVVRGSARNRGINKDFNIPKKFQISLEILQEYLSVNWQ